MKQLILVVALAATFSACKKQTVEGPPGPQGPQGPAGPGSSMSTGTISGKVRQYDSESGQYNTGLNTTTVSIAGTTLSTMTDASGNYSFSNISAGVYELWCSKPGTGTFKFYQNSFPGNGNLIVNTFVTDRATYTISNGYVKDTINNGQKSYVLRISLPASTKMRSVAILFSKSPNIDPLDIKTYEISFSHYIQPSATTLYQSLQYSSTQLPGIFGTNATVYAKIYPSAYTYAHYYDVHADINVNATLGTPLPSTFQLTMP